MELKEEDLILCTVRKIEGTTVIVDIPSFGEGHLSFPEIAAGRIRNIREYVVPNKKIVCKVLKMINNHPTLSLRRVTAKERDSVLDKDNKEKILKNMLKSITPEPEKIIEKIKEKYDLQEFYDNIRTSKQISEFLSKEELTKFEKILLEKKEKNKEEKRTIVLSSDSDQGIQEIKKVLDIKNATIHYLGSSQFSISVTANDFKEANHNLDQIIKSIESQAKTLKMRFELKEK
jgi:translation initiation factor 2 alpha subunit (eIF-2alpha)